MAANPRPMYLTVRYVRRMATERGVTADGIARRLGIAAADVVRILEERVIKGDLARRVYSRHVIGWTVEAIAEDLHLPPDTVRYFLFPPPPVPPPPRPPRVPRPIDPARLVPRQRHCRRQREGMLNRPRSPREQAALSAWDRLAVDPSSDVPELLPVEQDDLVEVEPEDPSGACPVMLDEDWGSWHDNDSRRNASLTDDQASRIRERRADGESRKALAIEFNVSVATITRITRRDTYRTAESHDLVEAPPPATPLVPAPEPTYERWVEPPGDRRRRGDD
jgi:hypothetical protein